MSHFSHDSSRQKTYCVNIKILGTKALPVRAYHPPLLNPFLYNIPPPRFNLPLHPTPAHLRLGIDLFLSFWLWKLDLAISTVIVKLAYGLSCILNTVMHKINIYSEWFNAVLG